MIESSTPKRTESCPKVRLLAQAAGILLLPGASLFTAKAQAEVLVSLNFSDGYTPNQSLIGQSGSGDVGLSGVFLAGEDAPALGGKQSDWTNYTRSVDVVPTLSDSSLTYQVKDGGTIQSGANVIELRIPGGAVQSILTRPLRSLLTAKTFYARILIRPVSTQQSNVIDLTFTLGNMGPAPFSSPGLGIFNSAASATISGLNKRTTTSLALKPLVPNLIVAKYTWDGDRYDTVSMWLNPSAKAEATPDATTKDPLGIVSMSYLGLGCANMSQSKYYFGGWMIATQWTDVVPSGDNDVILK